jgi:hypothetical protein
MVSPTLVEAPDATVLALERKLTDPKTTLAAKYRVLFSLRNIRGEAAHRALMTGEFCAASPPPPPPLLPSLRSRHGRRPLLRDQRGTTTPTHARTHTPTTRKNNTTTTQQPSPTPRACSATTSPFA